MGVEGAYAGGRPVYFVDGGRTPFLKARGTPGPFQASDLAVAAGKALLARQPFEPGQLDEVVFGCIIPGVDEVNIARIIALRLGCGKAMPAWTVQRNCGSGMQAIDCAAQDIAQGRADLVLAGGTEAMSQAPVLLGEAMVKLLADLAKARTAWARLKVLSRLRPALLKPVIGLAARPHRSHQRAQHGPDRRGAGQPVRHQPGAHGRLRPGKPPASGPGPGRRPAGGAGPAVRHATAPCTTSDEGLRRDADLPALARLKPAFERPTAWSPPATAPRSPTAPPACSWPAPAP